jgi:hypothetical protein
MNEKRAYSYIVLRYIHDVMTEEFINVGLVLYVPSSGTVKIKTRRTIGRIKDMFPDLDRSAFTAAMRSLNRSVDKITKESSRSPLLASNIDAGSIARKALPNDDSSLQWSSIGTGLTENVDKTFDRLYSRMIARYDEYVEHRKSDEEVWRPVRQKLEERHLVSRLQEKAISGQVDKIVFKHAWKNGCWNVYESVSLDLADAEGIKEKARRWLGHLSAVADGSEPFKPHFIVGAPENPDLRHAYNNAIAILRCAPSKPEIFEENQVDDLVSQIEDEVRAHDAGGI